MKKQLTLLLLLLSTATFAQNTLKSNFEKHVSTLSSVEFEGRFPQTKGDTLAVNYIVGELKKIPHVELMGNEGLQVFADSARRVIFTNPKKKLKEGEKPEYRVEKYPIKTFNVVSRINALPENNPNGESIIIGAHYDHMGIKPNREGKVVLFAGADDNASGTAFVIEYAREISKIRDLLKRDVIFVCFGAEEQGLLGSKYYAQNPLHDQSKSTLMVNFDMTGRMIKKGITVRGLGCAVEAPQLIASLPNKDELDLIWEFRTSGPTDYGSFYLEGVPAFSFSTRLHPDYHTERDTMEIINLDGMVMLFDYVKTLVNRFALEDAHLTYK
ncbi:MAG: M28 family peptidase [Rikenellaceae bacterium]